MSGCEKSFMLLMWVYIGQCVCVEDILEVVVVSLWLGGNCFGLLKNANNCQCNWFVSLVVI